MKKLIFLFSTILFTLATNAQIASYNFNTNANDTVGGYNATSFGSPEYVNGEYITLDSADYLELPDTLQSAFEIDSSLEIRVRFKVEGDYKATSGEEARIIITSKPKYFTTACGFDVTAREWDGQLQIITTFGGCEGCYNDCRQSEGKSDFIKDIEPGKWYDFSMKFIFDKQKPYICYAVNNTVSISYYDEGFDYDAFRNTLDQRQIFVGADSANKILLKQGRPSLELDIDYLTISSPALPGDTNKIRKVLQTLINEMNGTISLTEEKEDSLQGVFVNNWDNASFSAQRNVVLSYISTYAAHFSPIFDKTYQENPEDFPPKEAIQYIIEQWILDNQYGPSTVKEMEGLIFADHEQFPGAVSNAAPRLTGATFTIDGDYQTDPGFMLNSQEYARRPTGYYVPPGELVTITAPMSVVDKGLSIYVGAHNKNVEETWSAFTRFPRISTTYQIDTNTITVANPFGGGIYITVPDGSHFGALEFTVDGAVKAPYYCTKEGFSNSLTEFLNDIGNQYVPWLDMESSNFMCTISAGMASMMTDPDSILSIWDKTFDAYNVALGRPLERFRGEYIIVDCQSNVRYTFAPADYPMALTTTAHPYDPDLDLPVAVQQGSDWYKGQNAYHYLICHEFGHLHNMPTLTLEREANVHMPTVAVYNMVMGEPIDSAFVYSIKQGLNLDQAALDWILTPNFYKGNHISWDTLTNQIIRAQLMYQSRGYAKLVDIANLFGWEALGNIMGYFYDYKRENPEWNPLKLEDDQFIEAASLRMGFNMAPHFEFWGIIPSDSLVQKLDTMPVSEVIKERIIHFRSIVPAGNEAFQSFYNIMMSKVGSDHQEQYNSMLTFYDSVYANKIIARIDTILFKYYDYDSTFYNQSPVITGLIKPIVIGQNSSTSLALTDLIIEDPDNVFPYDFSLTIKDGTNYSISGDTIIPDLCFSGFLSVPITISDGIEESNEYLVNIEVTQISGIDYQMACEDFTWIDGITYTENNTTATYTLTNVVGCDSIVTLDLTIADTCNGSSVIGISTNDISIYPNPVHDHLVIELPSADFSKVEILDITGKKILTKGVERQKIIFHSLDIENGLYFIRITGKKGQTDTFKIIKK